MGAWLFSVFVMTPFAILQTTLAVFGIYSIINVPADLDNLFFAVFSLIVLLIVNKLVRLIRFGRGTSVAYNFIDLIVAPLNLPLILIVNMIAFISIFTYWDVDSRSEPDMDDGFWAAVVLYLFHLEIDTSDRKLRRKDKRGNTAAAYSSIEGKRIGRDVKYKIKNIAYQLLIFIFTMLHSLPVVIWGLNFGVEKDDGFLVIVGFVVTIFVYLSAAFFSAMYKGVTVDHWYYSDHKIENVTRKQKFVDERGNVSKSITEQTLINGQVSSSSYKESRGGVPMGKPVEKREKIADRGWNSYISFRMILYWIVGSFMFINQFVVLILAIVIPSKARFCPCRAIDAKLDTIGSKILHFLFGIADSHK